MEKHYSIGQMAKSGNCKVQTIRYYEQVGLLLTPQRNSGNQRIYNVSQYKRLQFIRHSRELGFSLDQIRNILTLSDNPSHSCKEVDQIARIHLKDIESKIKRLNGMKKELKRMINHCSGEQIADCNIVEVLSNHQLCLTDHQ
ncbi:MAG: helix-turn-helix domain-containing protein [Gammaproteobacteria bacterium]|nr:helix-turn-helix domain-containing protein [Gammaproteobacteria bacterium]